MLQKAVTVGIYLCMKDHNVVVCSGPRRHQTLDHATHFKVKRVSFAIFEDEVGMLKGKTI